MIKDKITSFILKAADVMTKASSAIPYQPKGYWKGIRHRSQYKLRLLRRKHGR